jgi:predicted amidophosphoribosyltransferase
LWYFWTMNEFTGQDATRPSSFARVRRGLHHLLRQALDVALLPLCPSCREPLGDDVGVCAVCWSKLSFIEPPYCARLGITSTYVPALAYCRWKPLQRRPPTTVHAAARYEDIVRTLVLGFKYGDRLDLAAMMGRWKARASADALLPVPLLWRRLWAPRFNKSAALAAAISKIRGVPVLRDALKRVRATAQQVGLCKLARAENVRGTFRVPAEHKVNLAAGGSC